MFLLVGEPDDAFLNAVEAALGSFGRRSIRLPEAQLYATPFELRLGGSPTGGLIFPKGAGAVPLDEVAGAMLRIRRAWWPDAGFDLADATFVFHETVAAWIAVLKALRAPVVNDFGLGWWLGDPSYAEALRLDLARHLGLRAATAAGRTGEEGWLVAGDLAVGLGARAVEDAPGPLRSPAFAMWQRRTGIHLARIELDAGEVIAVHPFPDAPPADMAGRVGEALARRLMEGGDA